MKADTLQSSRGIARWFVLAVIVIVAIVGGIVLAGRGHEATDDAQAEGRITQISTRVGGPVASLQVVDNQYVEAGTLLAQIDPREYEIAVARATAELSDARASAQAVSASVPIAAASTSSDVRTASSSVDESQAGITLADRQVEVARAQLVATEARVRERQATAVRAERDVERLKPLVDKDEIAQQQFDAAVAIAQSARAAAEAAQSDAAATRTGVAVAEQRALQSRAVASRAQAGLESARTAPEQLQATRARAAAAEARVQQADAVLAQAQLNLERATIKAPSAGIVSKRSIEVGQTLQPMQPLMALVSRDDVWVVANFKETQLADVRPGQSATVAVDGLDGREFSGTVESVGAATGAKFSLLPPENATGNYVKVVQRIPVKIVLTPGQDPDHRLRPGMSVYASISTK
ncbi:MAG: HlyD family secretion protein [Acidobacteria bacterium]|nr:HlyD family secretion protein [Acidobacteriota bacterium]